MAYLSHDLKVCATYEMVLHEGKREGQEGDQIALNTALHCDSVQIYHQIISSSLVNNKLATDWQRMKLELTFILDFLLEMYQIQSLTNLRIWEQHYFPKNIHVKGSRNEKLHLRISTLPSPLEILTNVMQGKFQHFFSEI